MEDKKPSVAPAERLYHVLEPSPFANAQEGRIAQKDHLEPRIVSGTLSSSGNQPPESWTQFHIQSQANAFANQSLWRPREEQWMASNLSNQQLLPAIPYRQTPVGQGSLLEMQENVEQNSNRAQGVPFVEPQRSTYSQWNWCGASQGALHSSSQTSVQSNIQIPSLKHSITESPVFNNSCSRFQDSVASSKIPRESSVGLNKSVNSIDNDSDSDMAGHVSDSIVYHSEGGFSSDQNSMTSQGDTTPDIHPPTRRRERIDWNTLKNHFHLPMNEASAKLGVCVTVLKKICRRFGISRWPHRKLKSVARHIERQELAFSVAPGVENLSYDEVLDLCRKRPHKRSRMDSDQESTKSEGDMPNILLHFGESKATTSSKTWKSPHTGIDIITESSVLVPASAGAMNDILQDIDSRLSGMIDSTSKKEFYLIFDMMDRIFDAFHPQKELKRLECLCSILKMGMWTCDLYGNRITERVGIENIPSSDLPFSVSTQVMDIPFLRSFEDSDSNSATNTKRCFRILESAESGSLYIVGKYRFYEVSLQGRDRTDKPVVLWAMMALNGNYTRQ